MARSSVPMPTPTTDGPPTASAPPPRSAVAEAAAEPRAAVVARYAWALTRIGLGWLFLWAFLDKAFGLGRATTSDQAWFSGGNPTKGYLASAEGPLAGLYHGMAGGWLVNVLFMAGLLALGVALMIGIAARPAALGGALMVLLMWSSHLPPSDNPFLDDHVIYALVLVGLAAAGADRTLGLGDRWARTGLVRRAPWLR